MSPIPYWGTHRCAPEMDIVTHYLSVKYSIGTSIDKGNKYFRNYNLGKSYTAK